MFVWLCVVVVRLFGAIMRAGDRHDVELEVLTEEQPAGDIDGMDDTAPLLSTDTPELSFGGPRLKRRLCGLRPGVAACICFLPAAIIVTVMFACSESISSTTLASLGVGDLHPGEEVPWSSAPVIMQSHLETNRLEGIFWSPRIVGGEKVIEWTLVYSDESMGNTVLDFLYAVGRAIVFGRRRDIETFYVYGNTSTCWVVYFIDVEHRDNNTGWYDNRHFSGIATGRVGDELLVYVRSWNHMLLNLPGADNHYLDALARWVVLFVMSYPQFSLTVSCSSPAPLLAAASREELDTITQCWWGRRRTSPVDGEFFDLKPLPYTCESADN